MIYEAHRGYRIKGHGFHGIMVRWYKTGHNDWWNGSAWVSLDDTTSAASKTNYAQCRSVRAFRRHLRKHPHMRGRLVLVSRYFGHNVEG